MSGDTGYLLLHLCQLDGFSPGLLVELLHLKFEPSSLFTNPFILLFLLLDQLDLVYRLRTIIV